MEKMISKYFISKYGKKICKNLLSDNTLMAENISEKNKYDQSLVKEHLNKLNTELNLNIDVNNTNWAFDFSGWLGKLSTSGENLKKYMIIGLEPHVERYDYQVIYGLSDKTPSGQKRFLLDLNNNNKFKIVCEDDCSIIWTNLFEILASNEQITKVLTNGNEQMMFDFLNQFYITDLCHFAPQSKAKDVRKIKGWKKIRFKVASHFLEKEIKFVKPKVLLTQGNTVFSELKRILKFKETDSYPVKFGKSGKKIWYIKTGQSPDKQYKVLSIPHFGSKFNYKTFYRKNTEKVKNLLIKNNLIE